MLTQADIDLLRFEDAHPRRTGLKQDRIRHDLGLTDVQYQQRLRRLVHDPDAVAAFPQLCSRVQRLNAKRAAQRAGLMRMVAE